MSSSGASTADASAYTVLRGMALRRLVSTNEGVHAMLKCFRIAAVAAALCFALPGAQAADHRDSPIATADPAADINDVYLFVNPNNANETIIVTTVLPFATTNSRFSDAVEYRLHIDNGGGPNQIVILCRSSNQSMTMTCSGPGGLNVSGGLDRIVTGTGMRMFAGLRDDPFFFDSPAFNATRAAVAPRFTNPGTNFFVGNTLTIALGIESNRLTNNGAATTLRIHASSTRVGDIGVNSGITGLWYDAANPGVGAHVEVLPPAAAGGPDRFAFTWYTYNRFGQQRWIVGDSTIANSQATVTNAISTSGGLAPPQFMSSQVTTRPFGTVAFNFTNCNQGTMTFTTTDGEFNSGTLTLTRLTAIKDLPCTNFVGGQIDRNGRPAINTALIDLLANTGKKDQYNRAVDPATWSGLFRAEIQANLTALDTLDGTTGNTLLPPATAAGVLVDDRLVINVARPQCDAYLAIETGNTTFCGGRTLARDVIDDTLGAVVGPGVRDNVGNDSVFLSDFPFAGPPR
jgi:hypothetical protein